MKISLVDNRGNPVTLSTPALLAFAFLALFSCVTYGAWQLKDAELFKTLSQGLLNILIAIAAYYWGSSSSSRAKDDTIASALNGPGTGDTSQ